MDLFLKNTKKMLFDSFVMQTKKYTKFYIQAMIKSNNIICI